MSTASTLSMPQEKRARKRKSKKHTAMRNPAVSWPTLVLGLFSGGGWMAVFAASALELIPMSLGFVLSVVLAYVCFTPMHDSAHKSVAKRKWVNEVMGRFVGLALLAPFPAFRFAHLQHHKHTNDHDHDPDIWSGGGRWWTLPFRWMTQDLYYYSCYVKVWSTRSVKERAEVVLTLAVLLSAAGWMWSAGYGEAVFWCWLVTSRLAIGLLAFFFDFLPHHPHSTQPSEDPYKATANLKGPALGLWMLYQNYHLVHHLYPGVPFYRYKAVWLERREKLRAKGAQVLPVWSPGIVDNQD